jgi:hydroxymethylbilane synthase
VTARLAIHPDVASRASDVLERLAVAGVDVEVVSLDSGAGGGATDPLQGVHDRTLDLALVGLRALRGSAAEDLTTVAVLPRQEFRDVVVTLDGEPAPLAGMRSGARVGIFGARRLAFLKAHRPDLEAVPLRDGSGEGLREGAGELDAAILGVVAMRQAGLTDRTAEVLDPKAWLPEPGEGALALVARHPIAEATALDHLPTRTALRTELALLDALDTDQDAPLGSLAQPSGRWIRLWAASASTDGARLVRSDLTGPLDEPEALGVAVAKQLTERGIGFVWAGGSR